MFTGGRGFDPWPNDPISPYSHVREQEINDLLHLCSKGTWSQTGDPETRGSTLIAGRVIEVGSTFASKQVAQEMVDSHPV